MLENRKIYLDTDGKIELNQVFSLSHTDSYNNAKPNHSA